MSLSYTTRHPTSIAVGLQEVKLYLKINHTEEDNLIRHLTFAATKECENYTNLALIEQKISYSVYQPKSCQFMLPVIPVSSIDKVKYSTLFQNTWKHCENYSVFANRLHLGLNYNVEKVCIEYTAGLAKSADILSSDIKILLLEHIAFLYEHREDGEKFPLSKYNPYKNYNLI